MTLLSIFEDCEMEPKIKVAVIGAGWFAALNHIPVLAERPEVVLDGVCRLGAEDLERVREQFKFKFASENYQELLARRPAIVVVASPHHMHFEHCRAALDVGAHVLCEKPMTLEPEQAWGLEAHARRVDRSLILANGFHYLPGIARLRLELQGGAVGNIEHVSCSFVSATRAVFEGDVGMARWKTHFFRPDRSTWQDPSKGGGFAYGQLSHSIALTLWLTGLDARTVSAHNFSPGDVDLCNAASVLCGNGAVVSLSGAAALPEGGRAMLRLLITGTSGVLEMALDRDSAILYRHDCANHHYDIAPGQWAYQCRGPVNDIVDIALGKGLGLAPAHIGAATVSVIDAIVSSAKSGGCSVPVFHPDALSAGGLQQ